MSDLFRAYAENVHRELNYSATWLPGAEISLGDVMVEQDGVFHREGGAPRGVKFEVDTDKHDDDEFSFESKGGVDIQFKATGEVGSGVFEGLGRTQAGASIAFSAANAVVFALHDVYVDRVRDVGELKNDLLARFIDGEFHRENAVVVEVVRAGSGTIIASTSSSANVTLRAEANLGQLTDLGKADLGLSLARYKDVGVKIVANSRLTPIFRAIRLRRSFWDKIWDREGEFGYALRFPDQLTNLEREEAFEHIGAYSVAAR